MIRVGLSEREKVLLLGGLLVLLGFFDFAFADFVAFAHERTPVGLEDSVQFDGGDGSGREGGSHGGGIRVSRYLPSGRALVGDAEKVFAKMARQEAAQMAAVAAGSA